MKIISLLSLGEEDGETCTGRKVCGMVEGPRPTDYFFRVKNGFGVYGVL